jgi:hypothetical protein
MVGLFAERECASAYVAYLVKQFIPVAAAPALVLVVAPGIQNNSTMAQAQWAVGATRRLPRTTNWGDLLKTQGGRILSGSFCLLANWEVSYLEKGPVGPDPTGIEIMSIGDHVHWLLASSAWVLLQSSLASLIALRASLWQLLFGFAGWPVAAASPPLPAAAGPTAPLVDRSTTGRWMCNGATAQRHNGATPAEATRNAGASATAAAATCHLPPAACYLLEQRDMGHATRDTWDMGYGNATATPSINICLRSSVVLDLGSALAVAVVGSRSAVYMRCGALRMAYIAPIDY